MEPQERAELVKDSIEFLRKMGDAHSSPSSRQQMYDRAQAIEDLEAENADRAGLVDSLQRALASLYPATAALLEEE